VREVQARSWLATYPNPTHGVTREWVEAFTGQFLSPDSLAGWETAIARAAAGAGLFAQVAVRDGRVIGMLFALREADGRAELRAIYVDPDLTGRGVGRALIAAFDGWAGGAPAFLDVAVYNANAIAFYERHGFRRVEGSDDLAEGTIPVITMSRPSATARRLVAIDQLAGSMAGVFPPDAAPILKEEWPD
jgi:ribosomal protein S18 acetylase RimI-like enzyme